MYEPEVLVRSCMVLMFMALSVGVAGCVLNSNPPEYVKELVVYKEGSEALMIYFVLADASGVPTTADGELALSIVEESYKPEKQLKTLFNTSLTLTRAQFTETTVGVGAFARKMVLCPLGRLPYSTFEARPSDPGNGLVYMVFTPKTGSPGNRSLSGKTRISF